MLSVVIAVHLMLVLGLIAVVLLQKSEGGGLVSSTSGFLSNRGTANALTRATALLAAGFFATSLLLSWLASHNRQSISMPTTPTTEAPAPTPGAPPPPTAPLSPSGDGVLKDLGGGSPPTTPSAPSSPPPPSEPKVPQSQ
jgi:preprotein translocase subunit SecG